MQLVLRPETGKEDALVMLQRAKLGAVRSELLGGKEGLAYVRQWGFVRIPQQAWEGATKHMM